MSAWRTGVAALLLAALGAIMILASRARQELPVHGVLEQELVFTDAEGKPFSTERLRGKIWVASFIFTNCRDTCPCIAAHLILVQEAMQADATLSAAARLVSFSVDPERDRPAELNRFAERYSADRRRWHFLTAPAGVVSKLAKEFFRLPLGEAPTKDGSALAPEILHSDRLCLVDGRGQLRGYYRPEAAEIERLVRDLKHLAQAAPKS